MTIWESSWAVTVAAAMLSMLGVLKVSYIDTHEPLFTQVLGLPEAPIPASAITINTWTKEPVPAAKKAVIAAYYNGIKRTDIGVGLLLSVLAEAGAADNTILILLGDNGGGRVQEGKMDVFEKQSVEVARLEVSTKACRNAAGVVPIVGAYPQD